MKTCLFSKGSNAVILGDWKKFRANVLSVPKEVWKIQSMLESPQQANYHTDEGMSVGKRSSAVASFMHNFFKNVTLGEEEVYLHCDNR